MISYLNKLSLPRINAEALNNQLVNKILKSLKRYRLECYILDSTTDIGIPSVIALIIDRTEKGPSVSIGLKAGFNVEDDIIGAIEEALMTRSWMRDEIYYGDGKKRNKNIVSFYDRGLYWFPVDMLKHLDFWIKTKKMIKLKKQSMPDGQKLEQALEKILKFSDVLYADIAPKNVKQLGFSIVKVIIPELVPVYLDERLKYLGISRLYEAPKNMRFTKNKTIEKDLNPIPHPFL